MECELGKIIMELPHNDRSERVIDDADNQHAWRVWQAGLSVKFTLPTALPRLKGLLILDNLAGHKTPSFVLWLVAHGIMPLYTPLGGSWLNMAESIQRIITRRALAGTHFQSSQAIITALEATTRGWNICPTPFSWGGKRKARRDRARARRHSRRLGGSGAIIRPHYPIAG